MCDPMGRKSKLNIAGAQIAFRPLAVVMTRIEHCSRDGERVIDVGERGIQFASLAKGDIACVHRHVCKSRVQAWVSLLGAQR
jgi:hypothetical protein